MQDEDTVVIDARNDYEYELGHFRKAIRPEIETLKSYLNGFVTIEKLRRKKNLNVLHEG